MKQDLAAGFHLVNDEVGVVWCRVVLGGAGWCRMSPGGFG